jgi:hypothetical protein
MHTVNVEQIENSTASRQQTADSRDEKGDKR